MARERALSAARSARPAITTSPSVTARELLNQVPPCALDGSTRHNLCLQVEATAAPLTQY